MENRIPAVSRFVLRLPLRTRIAPEKRARTARHGPSCNFFGEKRAFLRWLMRND